MNENNEYLKEISPKEFLDSGALWYINQQLHLFGLAIAYVPKENKLIPTRTKYRGFDEKTNDAGYRKMTNYLKNNIKQLESECD